MLLSGTQGKPGIGKKTFPQCPQCITISELTLRLFNEQNSTRFSLAELNSTLFSLYGYVLSCTDKKENQIFIIYKEIKSGAVAKSYSI